MIDTLLYLVVFVEPLISALKVSDEIIKHIRVLIDLGARLIVTLENLVNKLLWQPAALLDQGF